MASESGHWYKENGEPCYEVPYAASNKAKAGQLRGTTLRDAKKMDLVPSITTVGYILNSQALNKWMQDQIYLAAATTPHKRESISADEWVKLVKEDAEAQRIKAAELGTFKHGLLEKSLRLGQVVPDISSQDHKQVLRVIEILKANFGISFQDIEPEKSFASPIGVGGKMDLPALGKNFLGDYKTTEFHVFDGKTYKGNKSQKLWWPNHLYQLCGYAMGNGLGVDARLVNIFSSTKPDCTDVSWYEWTLEEKQHGFQVVKLMIQLWYSINWPVKLGQVQGALQNV